MTVLDRGKPDRYLRHAPHVLQRGANTVIIFSCFYGSSSYVVLFGVFAPGSEHFLLRFVGIYCRHLQGIRRFQVDAEVTKRREYVSFVANLEEILTNCSYGRWKRGEECFQLPSSRCSFYPFFPECAERGGFSNRSAQEQQHHLVLLWRLLYSLVTVRRLRITAVS
jgi:hypothetical protein